MVVIDVKFLFTFDIFFIFDFLIPLHFAAAKVGP